MIIKFGNRIYDVRTEYTDSQISKITNVELNNYSFEIQVLGKENFNLFKDELEKSRNGGIYELDTNENILREFKMDKWNYRYYNEFNSDDTIYKCTVWINQIEHLYTSTLLIEGCTVNVLDYEEEYDNMHKAIVIHATIKVDEQIDLEMIDRLKEKEYFEVIRPDINEQKIIMRFGKTIWSQHDGFKKRNVVLVEKTYDENDTSKIRGFFEPELSNIKKMLVRNIIYTNEIIRILNLNGLTLNQNELDRKVKENYKEIFKEYSKVDDAEEYSKLYFKD